MTLNSKILSIFLISVFLIHADTLLVNTSPEYSIFLPNNWAITHVSDSQDVFVDTTGTFPARLSIVRHQRNTTTYPTPDEWSRAYFIANKLVTQYGVDPWGMVLFADSSINSKQGDIWAPQMYCEYYSLDSTTGSWAEYIRYVAVDQYGYELYAIGDTTELKENLNIYASILMGIVLPGMDISSTIPASRSKARTLAPNSLSTSYTVDIRGRRIPSVLPSTVVPGVYVASSHNPQRIILPR